MSKGLIYQCNLNCTSLLLIDKLSQMAEPPSNKQSMTHAGNVRLSSVADARELRTTAFRTRSKSKHSQKATAVKAVLLGDYGAGKTTLFRRVQEPVDEVAPFSSTDTGSSLSWDSQSADMCTRAISTTDSKNVKLYLWDTAGAERYRTFTLEYFRKCLITLLVYRTDRPQSLSNLRVWMAEADDYLSPGGVFVLVGNLFTDNAVEVSTEMADDFAKCNSISIHVRLSLKSTDESVIIGLLTRAVEEVLRVKGLAMLQVLQEDTIRLYDPPPPLTQDREADNCSC